MSKKSAGQIHEMGGRIEEFGGAQLRDKVMTGSEKAVAASDMRKVALWVKESMDRLDSLTDRETSAKIMDTCGRNCCRHNKRIIQTRVARRQKFASEEEYLKAEVKKPPKGTRLELRGDLLVQYYTPHSYSVPMRCFCSLINKLPESVNASPTFCLCGGGFTAELWENILGRPVQVETIKTAISGADECEFVIHLK